MTSCILQYVPKFETPDELTTFELLGKGSNNKVFRAKWEGDECVLRAPRRRSDTQQRGSALWEHLHTVRASELEVGPAVHGAWCARHANGAAWPSGLYMVTDCFDHDLDRVLGSARLRGIFDDMGPPTIRCLETLANDQLFVYDLKPSNVVVRAVHGEAPQARIIDFGSDFCEWGADTDDASSRTPLLTFLRRMVDSVPQHCAVPEDKRTALVSHILFACMLVQLSATTTFHLYEDRGKHRLSREERRAVHPFSASAAALLDSMQGNHRALLRRLMRTDEVRSVMRHYLGRRNSGTRRVLRLARGHEQ